jgi:hypothetical protein
MYADTASGTRPFTDAPRAIAARTAVDDTGAVRASIKKILACDGIAYV